MARPERIRARDAARAAEGDRTKASGETVETLSRDGHGTGQVPAERRARRDPLDVATEARQSSRQAAAPEGDADAEEALNQRVAKRLGWVPKEEWKRDPAKWSPASDYLERTPNQLVTLKDKVRRSETAAAAAIDETRRTSRAEAEADLRRFATEAKPDEAMEAARRLAAASAPDPTAASWAADRPWFAENDAARAVAYAKCEELAKSGTPMREQLEAADAEVRKRFPELFEATPRREEPAEQHEAREQPQAGRRETRQPPEMAGGQRSGGGTQKAKVGTFDGLPPDVKASFDKTFRARGVDPERYAKAWNRDQGR